MMKLKLEHKQTKDKTVQIGNLVMTPSIDEDYWIMRVRVSKKQAVVAFPKFFTIGIGFQQEEDWNTNLPYTSAAVEIYEHIKHNKGARSIKRLDCIKAIEMLQAAIKAQKNKEAK